MASFNEINNEWSTLCQVCPHCWTMDDLQLAAELGKTLLERNKDLENTLKHQQNVIEDNNQEIEYLTKQTIALKEVNDSRLRIYEQLEVNIQDLERANHRLAVENSVDKKLIKNLTGNVETLEARCEELQAGIEDLRTQVDVLRRRPNNASSNVATKFACGKRANTPNSKLVNDEDVPGQDERDFSGSARLSDVQNEEKRTCVNSPLRHPDKTQQTQTTPNREDHHTSDVINAMEQIEVLVTQLRESRDRYSLDQHRIMELEEQLTALNDQNRSLEKRLSSLNKKEEHGGKTMHEEFTTLEEVRQGQLCQRCLRTVENGNRDCDLSSLCDVGLEDDDHSMIDALTSATSAAASGITPNQHRYRTSFNIEIQDRRASTNKCCRFVRRYLFPLLMRMFETIFQSILPQLKQYVAYFTTTFYVKSVLFALNSSSADLNPHQNLSRFLVVQNHVVTPSVVRSMPRIPHPK